MQLVSTSRDALLKPLQVVSGIVERRHTLPILANLLLRKSKDKISFISFLTTSGFFSLEIILAVIVCNPFPTYPSLAAQIKHIEKISTCKIIEIMKLGVERPDFLRLL